MSDSPEIAVALIMGVCSVVSASVSAVFAYRASRNSRPVANGFTSSVTGSLVRIENRLDSHLEHHAAG